MLGEFTRPLQNIILDLAFPRLRGQRLRKSFRQTIPKIDIVNAALMQQTTARAPLRSSGDFAAIQHHIGTDWIGETTIAAIRVVAGLADPGSFRQFCGPGVNDAGYMG